MRSENGNFLELKYEMVENLLSLHMLGLQIRFQECMSSFKARFIYPAELGYNTNARFPLIFQLQVFKTCLCFYYILLGLLSSIPLPMSSSPKESESVKENVVFTEYFIDQGGVDITCCSASGLKFSLSHFVPPSPSHPNHHCCILVLLNLIQSFSDKLWDSYSFLFSPLF